MKNKYGWILIGLLFIFEGIFSFLGYKIFLKFSGWINITNYGSLYLIIIGLCLVIYGYKKQEKQEIFSKCPNCKEVFNYNELTNGKCKNCKEIDTINIEEYFKKYPTELQDKNE
ncbi:MAG: hypothetical protein PHR66_06915 [Desulfuromonadaceae bacterium]|nr:hypothetical protein [Desulfuromonadaceae bacterium]